MVTLNLVDVNNILHIGNHRFPNAKVDDVRGQHFLTGAMFMLTNLLRGSSVHPTQNLWVFCFDRSSSFRRQLDPNYKAGRPKLPAHLKVQGDALFYWLKEMGYNVLAIDGLEADDLISSLVHQYRPAAKWINIFSTDRDLAYHVNGTTELVSSNSRVATVKKSNYESTAGKRGHYVHYNTIWLYKVICGDGSDKIPPICDEPYLVYNEVIKKLKELQFPLERLAEFELLAQSFLLLSPRLREKAEHNWMLMRPYIIEDIQLTPQNINLDKVYEFCSIFGMSMLVKKFGMEFSTFPESVTKHRIALIDRVGNLQQQDFSGSDLDDGQEAHKNEIPAEEKLKVMNELKQELRDIDNSEEMSMIGNVAISADINGV